MMKLRLLSLMVLFCGVAVAQPAAGPEGRVGSTTPGPIEWPHHKQAAIILTYDDALLSQLDIAIPQLQKAGLTATFFLTSDLDYKTLPRWRAVATFSLLSSTKSVSSGRRCRRFSVRL